MWFGVWMCRDRLCPCRPHLLSVQCTGFPWYMGRPHWGPGFPSSVRRRCVLRGSGFVGVLSDFLGPPCCLNPCLFGAPCCRSVVLRAYSATYIDISASRVCLVLRLVFRTLSYLSQTFPGACPWVALFWGGYSSCLVPCRCLSPARHAWLIEVCLCMASCL